MLPIKGWGPDSDGRLEKGLRGFVIVFPSPSVVHNEAEQRNDAMWNFPPRAVWKLGKDEEGGCGEGERGWGWGGVGVGSTK